MLRGFTIGAGVSTSATSKQSNAKITAGTKYEFNLDKIMAKHGGKKKTTDDEIDYLINSLPGSNAPVGSDFVTAPPSGGIEKIWLRQNNFNN